MTTTATKERPIIMSGQSIPGILDGSKTQTRRVVDDQPGDGWAPVVGDYNPVVIRRGEEVPGPSVFGAADETWGRKCPYGKPGDRLWVREAYMVQPTPGCTFGEAMKGTRLSAFYRDGDRLDIDNGWEASGPGLHVWGTNHEYPADRYGLWRSPIHMTRWAARILLEIVDVSVQRLQDIFEADCWAEGVFAYDGQFTTEELVQRSAELGMAIDDVRPMYSLVWDQKNAKRGFPWSSNPWVWAITFRRLESGLAVPA